jgi:type I restriction-modification system DNA methylase subunit
MQSKPESPSPDAALWRSAGTSAFWAVQRLASERQPSQTDEYFLPKALALGLARLLSATERAAVLDPFCGAGSTLWAVREVAEAINRPVRIEGRDRNATSVNLARAFATLIDAYDAQFTVEDWLSEPDRAEECEYLISAPPMSLRLTEPVALPWGAETTDGDVAILARAASALRPNGRAVLLMSRKILFAGGISARLRDWLATHLRISALIGLPPGMRPSTSIPTVILVIESKPPSETLVAELQDDWAHQLSLSGPFLAAYRAHIA